MIVMMHGSCCCVAVESGHETLLGTMKTPPRKNTLQISKDMSSMVQMAHEMPNIIQMSKDMQLGQGRFDEFCNHQTHRDPFFLVPTWSPHVHDEN